MLFLKAFYLSVVLSSSIFSFSYASSPKVAIPEFCEKNFPAINPRDLQTKIRNTADDQQCILDTHDGLQIPVGVRDLLQSYTSIQRNQNQRVVNQFQSTMRKKVAEGIGQSRRPYEGLYDLMNCEKVASVPTMGMGMMGMGMMPVTSSRTASRTYIDSDCEKAQKFTPQCADASINQVLRAEERDFLAQKEGHVDAVLNESAEIAGVPIEHAEVKTTAARQEAEEALKKAKKFSFLKRNIETALLAKSLVSEKEEIKNAGIAELSKFPSPRRGCNNQRTLTGNCATRKRINEKYAQLEEERQYTLARMYEEYPTAFTLDNNWGVFDWFNYEIAPSDFAKELDSQLIQKHPRLAGMKRPEHVKNFLNSEAGKELINSFTKDIVEKPVASIETKGREATFAELRKKREAIEHICKSDGSDLHHFTGLAQEVLSESADNPKNLINNQAAYCYLVQTSPLEDGGFPTGALIGAGALVVAGVALQFIPGLGTAAGAMAFAKGAGVAAGIVGGAVFSLDAVDRYQTSAAKDNNMKSVYHSANSWATAEELIASKDNRNTQLAFAAGEVALSAVDAAFIVRPAISLAVRLSSRVPRTTRTANAAVNTATNTATGARAVDDVVAPVARSADDVVAPVARSADDVVAPVARNADEAAQTAGRGADEVADVASADRAVAAADEASEASAALLKRVENLDVRVLEQADVNKIYTRMSRGLIKGDDMLDDFASLFKHKGSYGSAFSGSPKALAVKVYDALKNGNKDEALAILKASFEGKNSAGSLNRMGKLNDLIENTYKAQQVGLTNTPAHKMLLEFRQTSTAARKTAVDGMKTRLNAGEVLTNDEYLKIVLHSGAHMEAPMSQASHQLAHGLKGAIEAGNRTEAHRLIDDYYKGANLPDRGPIELKRMVDGSMGSAQARGIVATGREFYRSYKKPILLTAGLFGISTLFTGDAEVPTAENEVPAPDQTQSVPEVVKPKIKFRYVAGKQLDIKILEEETDFTIEAFIDGVGALPTDGKIKVECKSSPAEADFCQKETGFKENSGEQKVKLFKQPEYTLTFSYITADEGYTSETFTTEPLFRKCTNEESGPAVDLCNPEEERSPAEETELDNERDPFWWEGLEPNQPPPPFMPGPPLRMRSFMLPGFI